MYLEILTPQKKIFGGNVKLLKVPGSSGSFEILVNHAPIISTLEKGIIKVVTSEDEKQNFSIESGVVQVAGNKIIVLVESLTLADAKS
jgi:F-type H+-transporting ATPase subunit epsilon